MPDNSYSKITRGYIYGVIAGMSFGLIPLFSIPVLQSGTDPLSVLVYRFLFGSAAMLAVLLAQRTPLRISAGQFLRISVLSLFYIGTATTTLRSYEYLSSGVATALVYTDPIWCALIGLLFLGERFSWKLTSAIVLTTVGVMLLTNLFSETQTFSAAGVMWGLMSGLTYALYLLFLPRLRLGDIPGLKLTFYVFFLSMVYLALWQTIAGGGIEMVHGRANWCSLILLGLLPTALSNICVTGSLRLIDSTVVALLGAFEPVTAMAVGVCFLGDPFSPANALGLVLVLMAVAILTVRMGRH